MIGQSRMHPVDRLVYVSPSVYGQLPLRERYSMARLIGRLLHLDDETNPPQNIMLIGPGRWGTTTPSLGVPVRFAEIDTASVLCEIVAMREDLVPDVSLGTHFFNDLVEMDMLYLALFPGREGNGWNEAFFDDVAQPSGSVVARRREMVACGPRRGLAGVVLQRCGIALNANAMTQQVVCYLERGEDCVTEV